LTGDEHGDLLAEPAPHSGQRAAAVANCAEEDAGDQHRRIGDARIDQHLGDAAGMARVLADGELRGEPGGGRPVRSMGPVCGETRRRGGLLVHHG
jgi:hypothetical protein